MLILLIVIVSFLVGAGLARWAVCAAVTEVLVTPIDQESADAFHFGANTVAITILQQVKDRQKDRRETEPIDTQKLIREARDGGMYGE